jgi:hypothetical protein
MCTAMVDIHTNIEAIPRPQDTLTIHRNVRVQLKNGTFADSRGGIDVNEMLTFFGRNGSLADYFSASYLEESPRKYKELDLSIAKKSCENLRLVHMPP